MDQSPTVLLVDPDAALRAELRARLLRDNYRVLDTEQGESALELLGREDVAIVFASREGGTMDGTALLRQVRRRRPDLPFVLTSQDGSIQAAVSAIREGASDFLVKPFGPTAVAERVRQLVETDSGAEMVVEDPYSRELLRLAGRVAASEVTVLIHGESGVGKEVFARYLHVRSTRAEGPFVAVNCAAIPENMLEAMLFGYERGAFTGAYESRAGKFEQAQGGTLLLDEISEMDLGLQAKLLRVLQEREVERLGGKRTLPLDVRVMATTNRDLRSAVAEGRFREDLFYRLSVFPLLIPPLRERPGDVLPLARRFMERHGRGIDRAELTPCGAAKLMNHTWPGNVRELDNVIQRALILRSGPLIDADSIQFESVASGIEMPPMTARTESPVNGHNGNQLSDDLRTREEQLILDALRSERGRRKQAAERLGISPRTLRYKLARLREAGIAIP
ncbi:sigma-54-dependent Fis family transcriptional regulator [Thioalkalivibrio denitrificans]|uniref:Sigma-54-dependent Fis family transcriptional regulator n=1 Tax=Thioalkalivibrio denitrificans TaxID=108003 RepID=A0A1V3NMR4_9GAMM|nr:sigma-54 dependent transcriptional regulator [Thioalkalivibrio denitrificans]OOG26188.1 sigma-54-dependent Fis family transcriptional regulator [Thioalkalivibrio denitrificans]